jgi:hypothetical protein
MYCSACGTKNPNKFKFCSSCGVPIVVPAASPAPAPNSSSTPAEFNAEALSNLYQESAAPKTGMSPAWKRALTVGAIILIGNIIWFGARPYLIGVTINSPLLESNIVAKYAENGISVTADCPDPFVARPGESRNCLVTDDYGTTAIVKVSVENTNGDVTWAEQ